MGVLSKIFLGIGSNLGDRQNNIQKALLELNAISITVEQVSTIIETDPEGGPSQGKFLNAVARCCTQLRPHDLLKNLKTIESKLGRVQTVHHGPRTIDLDILLYDQQKISTKELTIPHPRMCERAFVMEPLKEIHPSFNEELCHASH